MSTGTAETVMILWTTTVKGKYSSTYVEVMTLEPRRSSNATTATSKGKGKATHVFKLTEDIHASEFSFLTTGETPAHKFEVSSDLLRSHLDALILIAQVALEPAAYTEEKFALYNSYQKEIHHEANDKQPSGFKRFLVQNSLVVSACASVSKQNDADYGPASGHRVSVRTTRPSP